MLIVNPDIDAAKNWLYFCKDIMKRFFITYFILSTVVLAYSQASHKGLNAAADTAFSSKPNPDLVIWHVQVGAFRDYNNVKTLKDKIRKSGFEDVFVVAYKGAQRISNAEASELAIREIKTLAAVHDIAKEMPNDIAKDDSVSSPAKETAPALLPVIKDSSLRPVVDDGALANVSLDNVSIHFAQTYARFRFIDSEGNKDEDISFDFRSGYGVNYTKFFTPEIFIKPELGYKNLGASSMLNNQKLDWSLHYLDLNCAGGYLLKLGHIQPYGGLALYMAYLYKANQTIGLLYYDLLAEKDMKRFDYGVNVFGGIKYAFTRSNAFFFEIRNSTGLGQLETKGPAGQNEKTFNRSVSLHFGVSFKIDKKKSDAGRVAY